MEIRRPLPYGQKDGEYSYSLLLICYCKMDKSIVHFHPFLNHGRTYNPDSGLSRTLDSPGGTDFCDAFLMSFFFMSKKFMSRFKKWIGCWSWWRIWAWEIYFFDLRYQKNNTVIHVQAYTVYFTTVTFSILLEAYCKLKYVKLFQIDHYY